MPSQPPATPSLPNGAEKRADIRFASKDEALRQDVHDLGVVIGQLLSEQCGPGLLRRVEIARRMAIQAREGDASAGARLSRLLEELTPGEARDFIRGFATYFQVVNTAEQVHRIRRRRDYLKDGLIRQPGGLEDLLCGFRSDGVTAEELQQMIGRIEIEPVLTGHPTAPVRRTILRRNQDIVRRLIDIQNPELTPGEKAAYFASIRDDITAIWQTEENPGDERTIPDELEHALFFLTDVIYRVVPVFYESFQQALAIAWDGATANMDLPVMLRFSSWIGGDMVARPGITARTIRETLARHRSLILDKYFRECAQLAEKLSQTTTRTRVSGAVIARIEAYSGYFPNTRGRIPQRHREMPYRIFLRLVMARLQSTYDEGQYPYESAEELLADIRLVAESLAENHGEHAGLFAVRRLMRRIETFGFHLMTLDLRQDARDLRAILGRCLGEQDWCAWPADRRKLRLRQALEDNESPSGEVDNEARRAISMFQAISFCRRRFGERAVGPFIVSRTEGVDDLLGVILLARWGELRRRGGMVPLDIAPALETPGALAGAEDLFGALVAEPAYRDHLQARGLKQKVLVGFSEQNTEVDLASARWMLHRAQAGLQACADEAGVELRLFHGRCTALPPGGGRTHATILSAAEGSVRYRCRAVEPGELVANKFGVRAIALRTLEQALTATARASRQPAPSPRARALRSEVMETLVVSAAGHYSALVKGQGDFDAYFRLATPVDVIRRMQGAEPRDADPEGGIPLAWALAWTQSRNMLPAWYGFGTGLARALERHGPADLQSLLRDWPFFRTLVGDVELALAKSDIAIAERYSRLAGELHDRFFPLIRDEFERTTQLVLQLRGQRNLLENNTTLRRSIRLRNPYVDPISLLQIDLLRRWRVAGSSEDALLRALFGSVNGISRGLQDAG
ncbi:MAG: phosphoenolpyruvate carboxylase [Chromatiales bacterium]|nr:phosphoenolpyruvate carboxylase [Chromatiales bacterium]